MLDKAKEIIERIAQETDGIILMHSLSGKDSIALLDLCYPHFKRIVCVYMYVVPNLRHIQQYYVYAKRRYPNAEFIQVPHFSLFDYRKNGFMGMVGNPKQRKWRFRDIIQKVRDKTGLYWACIGFKQADSLNRRLMLRTYKDGDEAICWAGGKFYPLSIYYNRDIIKYISERNLKSPEWYDKREQSSGVDITDIHYLSYLREHYPDDLERIYKEFPAARRILINKDNAEQRDTDDTTE